MCACVTNRGLGQLPKFRYLIVIDAVSFNLVHDFFTNQTSVFLNGDLYALGTQF